MLIANHPTQSSTKMFHSSVTFFLLPIVAVSLVVVLSSDFAIGFSPSSLASLSSRVSTSKSKQPTSTHRHFATTRQRSSRLHLSRVTFAERLDVVKEKDSVSSISSFDPLDCSNGWDYDHHSSPLITTQHCIDYDKTSSSFPPSSSSTSLKGEDTAPTILAISTLLIDPSNSYAATVTKLSEGDYNPETFKPVCAASDTFYRFLQGSTRAVVGDENFSEYGPLIAGGLLRVRLELCVVESFFNEAVGPFIKENGLSWILPLHENVETFLAGTIFALATTFILVGSTKLIQIIAFYGDLIIGGPCRLFGGFFFDRARGEPVTLDVSFFGFWKTRLVGPPVDFNEEKKVGGGERTNKLIDFEKVKPTDVPLLALSGGVKVVGEASKVSCELHSANTMHGVVYTSMQLDIVLYSNCISLLIMFTSSHPFLFWHDSTFENLLRG